MCGIAGLVGKHELSREAKDSFIESSKLMKHRGPDAFGMYEEENLLLIHLRLSIIDLDPRSNQPFLVESPQGVGVFNGELYNYKHLREKYGVETSTKSDTEVLLKTFLRHGKEVVKEWNGIFATAIYQNDTGELSLIRDRFGVKPLYIFENDHYIAFASEAKVILNWLPEFQLRDAGLSQYLWYGNATDGGTMISGLRKLSAASIMTIPTRALSGCREEKYWVNPGTEVSDKRKETELTSELRNKLENAVTSQLVSDVPLGVFLSGGVDSSSIVAFASRSITKLDTYTVSYDYNIGGKSEIEKARLVSRKFGTNLHELKVEAPNIIDDIDNLVFQYDEPFAEAGSIPLYQLARECGKDKRVILQGDGGDEFFAGYRRYNIMNSYHFWKSVSSLSSKIITGQYSSRMKRLDFLLHQETEGKQMAYFLTEEVPYRSPYLIMTEEIRQNLTAQNPFSAYEEIAIRYKNENRVQKLLYADVELLLQHSYLEKVDKATMKCSIEARVPFLDYELTSMALALPSHLKVRRGEKKYLLRKAMRGILPDSILDAPKRGFDVPYKEWLRSTLYDYARDCFDVPGINRWMDTVYLKQILEEHRSRKTDHGPILWKGVILARWLSQYSGKITGHR